MTEVAESALCCPSESDHFLSARQTTVLLGKVVPPSILSVIPNQTREYAQSSLLLKVLMES